MCHCCKRLLKKVSICRSCGKHVCRRCEISHFVDAHEFDEDQKHMQEIGGQ